MFFIVTFSFLGLYSWLMFVGIKIDHINYKQYNISGLYIKIDKKLILELDKLHINNIVGLNNKSYHIKDKISNIPLYLKFFQNISVKEIIYGNDKVSLSFDQNKLFFESKDIKIIATPHFIGETINFDIKNINIKKYNIDLDGKLKLDYFKNNAFYIGNLKYKGQILNFNIKSDLNYTDFYITSSDLHDIKVIKDFIELDPSIESWLYDNVQGIHNLDYLTFKYDIDKNKIIEKSIDLSINIKNATIKFKDKLSNVNTNSLNIKYKNGLLKFVFDKPKYKTILLDNSTLVINNLNNDNDSVLHLNLQSDTLFNDYVIEILNGYDITLPLKQIGGSLNTNLDIDLNLNNNKLDITGYFKLEDTNIDLDGFKFSPKKADVTLKNNIINIQAHNTFLLEDKLKLKNFNLLINTNKNIVDGHIDIDKFNISTESMNIINLENMRSSINIDFNNNIKIKLEELGINIDVQKKNTLVLIENIRMYKNHSDILTDYDITEGNIGLNFISDKIIFNTHIAKHNSPLDLQEIDLEGTISGNNIKINTDDKKLKIDIAKNKTIISINDIDIIKENIKNKKNEEANNSIIEINAKNSNIILANKKRILSNKFSFNRKGKDIEFLSTYANTNINFKIKNNVSTINISNANDKFINNVLGNNDFLNGGTINIIGTTQVNYPDVFKGSIKIKDTNLKDFTALNNVITLIQSSSAIANPLLALPSLFRIVKGDMTLNGYKVLKGNIKYVYNHKNEFLNLYDIKTKGAEIDFDGEAKLNLKNRTIDSSISVIFMKDISFITSKIPLINKIFLDDKKNISTNIQINGDLDNPTSEFVIFNKD